MLRRKYLFALLIGLIGLVSVLSILWQVLVNVSEVPGSGSLPPLVLTLAWNGESFEVPPPAVLPDCAVRDLRYQFYRWPGRWLGFEGTITLEARDRQRRKYVAKVNMNFTEHYTRRRRGVIIETIRTAVYRPDGTLEVDATSYSLDDAPETWTTYRADGKTKQSTVRVSDEFSPGSTYVESIVFYDPDGKPVRQYQGNPHALIFVECELGQGAYPIRQINGSYDLLRARPEDLKPAE